MRVEEEDAPLIATVTRVLLWYDGPVLSEMTTLATDGSVDLMLAMALPEEEGWSHIIARPTRERMAAWEKKSCDLRDLQLDAQTRHYLVRGDDRCFGPGGRLPAAPFAGTPPEAWLCDADLFVDDVNMFENDNTMVRG